MSDAPGRRRPVAAVLRSRSGLTIELLENGSIFAIRHGEVLINQVLGSPLEGGIGNLYLRRRTRAGITPVPLLGPASSSRFGVSAQGAAWEGSIDGLDYSCLLRLDRRSATWFWTVTVTNRTVRRVSLDAVLAQDLGNAHEGAVRSSELYTSHYIDHAILDDPELGFVICSRQNLPQGEAHPWIMHGCLTGAVGYLTDGFQFYGLASKATGQPAALRRRRLTNRRYQYEVALPTLQSRPVRLSPGSTGDIAFFAAFEADHPAASSADDSRRGAAAASAYRDLQRPAEVPTGPVRRTVFGAPLLFASRQLEADELDRHFGPERRHAEHRDGALLSFFHGGGRHVVLRAKELVQERPTGHILSSGGGLLPSDGTASVTAWAFGVFASHLCIGNSAFNKVLSVCRNPLNVLKASGQRIFIGTDRGWELLGLPSAFEMAPGSARWIYRDERRTLSVSVTIAAGEPACRLEVRVLRGGPLELLISHDLVLGANEHGVPGRIAIDASNARVEMRPAADEPMRRHYPEATFFLVSPDPDEIASIGGDELLHEDGRPGGTGYVVVRTRAVQRFSLVLTGSILDAARARDRADAFGRGSARAAEGEAAAADHWSGLGDGVSLGGGTGRAATEIARLDELLPWLGHDAMVHYTTPHGLEQHTGAAWGVRDVCQGPAELLVATGNPAPLREVLRIVYEHQIRQTGDWPQWFMFDRYREVQAPDSHADVIHWPLKALCDYVETTDDLTILEETVAYTDARTKAVTEEVETIFAHTERQLARIEEDCIPVTALVAFGGGDWEDTLQPADPAMARRMVSAWTVELAYQTLGRYREVCERAGRQAMATRLNDLCERMRADFNRYLLPDGVVAGLVHFGPEGVEHFLHPRDRKTGVAYRLLPMTRGMISGIFDPEQMRRHVALIDRRLTFPDGVRLMDRPMEYRGGVSRYFKRAESAANFGREVGLQYVHAHIRYVEAMAHVGRPDRAWWGLLAVCPVGLEQTVPNAIPRQANAYFSSSDGAFLNRYHASRQFARLRTGRVGVKGGWRVYSSGPGIYLNQLVSNVLGLRTRFEHVVFDPVLPAAADGLTVELRLLGRAVRCRYRVSGVGFGPHEVRVNRLPIAAERMTDNPYRAAGIRIPRRDLLAALNRSRNEVEILL